MTPPINIDGESENYSNVTIDGQTVEQITIDGQEVLSTIPASGVARYDFEEDVTDSWFANDGSNNGATFTTDSEVGTNAISFDGTDDLVDLSSTANSDEFSSLWDGAFSCAFRIKDPTPNREGYILEARNSSNERPIDAVIDSNGNLQFVRAPASGRISGTTDFADGNYHLGVFATDGSTITMYVDDGNQEASDSADAAFDATVNTLFLGARNGGGRVTGHFDGIVDDMRFYSKELSSAEVSNLFNTGSIN